MTTADVLHLHPIELPMLASDPRVRVVADVALDRLESCEPCVQRSFADAEDIETEIPAGRWRLTYHFRPGGPEHYTDLCGCDCGDQELDEVLNLHSCIGVVLHVPPYYLPGDRLRPAQTPPVSVDPDDDPEFLLYHSLRRLFQTLPNDAAADLTGPLGFEQCRKRVLKAVSELGINRAEQLRRGAA